MTDVSLAATPEDHRLAADLARQAGELLMALREELVEAGATASELKAEGDSRSNEFLMDRLTAARPADAILSEEGDRDHGPLATGRLDAERVWIVDPLDGTREYGEPPRMDWAVHVALAVDGVPVVGAVALPAQSLVLNTAYPLGLRDQPSTPPRVIMSRTRRPASATHLAQALGAEVVEMGSAGAKVAAVITGTADVYAHNGGQYEWDSCAPVAVALATGLHATRLDGQPLIYNNADPLLPDLVVCHPALVDQVRQALDSFEA